MRGILKISGNISPHFKEFLFYKCLSDVVCGVETILSTHSMFDASGVGNSDVLSVLVNLSSKDIIGQIASLPIINKLSKMGDQTPIKHLGFSIAIFEISNFVEHLTPLLPTILFIPVAAFANIGKNIGFTGTGSFNANLINKISLSKDNISEIYSKITSFSTISFSFGMMIGIFLVKIIPCYYTRLGLLVPLSILRFSLLAKSVKGILE